jgi:excisionase family DNA binding protein
MAANGLESTMLLTVKQVAEKVGVSLSLVYDWCNNGLLPHYRFGKPGRRGKIMVDPDELGGFVASCRREAKPPDTTPSLKHIKLG